MKAELITRTSSPVAGFPVRGSLLVLGAEALSLPAGLVVTSVLTRNLGPDLYGLLAIAITVSGWFAWLATAPLSARAVAILVSRQKDWRPVAALALRANAGSALIAGTILAFAAKPIASAFGDGRLVPYLQLLALEVVFFALSRPWRDVLTGLGETRVRSIAAAARSAGRMILTIILIGSGWSILGAVTANIAAAAIELMIYARTARLPWRAATILPLSKVIGITGMLFVYSAGLKLFERADLLILAVFGASTQEIGFYGAAQSLSVAPGIFGVALAPLFIGVMGRSLRDGDKAGADRLAHNAIRACLAMFPAAMIVCSIAPDLVTLLFGISFRDAAPVVTVLFPGAICGVLLSTATAMLVVAERNELAAAIVVGMLVFALFGYVIAVPAYGLLGAALVTATVTCGAGVVATLCACHVLRTAFPFLSLLRNATTSAIVWGCAVLLPTGEPWTVLISMPILCLVALVSLLCVREVSVRDLRALRAGFIAQRVSNKRRHSL